MLFRSVSVSVLIVILSVSAACGFQGGPDGFGYFYESTQDLGDTISFSWLDPAGHEVLGGWYPNNDDGWVRIGLPFRFPFYGDTLDSIVVCTNGFIEFPVTFTSYVNQSLPASSFPFLIATFWDDLSPAQSGSVRRYDDPGGQFTCITWLDVVRFDTADTLSCQALLFADGSVRMNFLRAPLNASSSTVGIQGQSGNYGFFLPYVFDGDPEEHIVEDSTSVRFYFRRLEHDVGVLRVVSPTGWVPANSQLPVSGTFKNYGLSTETFPVSARIIRTRYPRDTIFERFQTVTDLAPGESTNCYFGDWLSPPNPDSWHVLFVTGLATDMLRRNDTCRVVTATAPPALGTLLGTWNLPGLGDGMNLAGITYRPDSNRFYLALLDPNRVASFRAGDLAPMLSLEPFELQNFFGNDIIWGITWDRAEPGFWITHSPASGDGCIAARYEPDGSFTGDTWDLAGIETGVWFAGLSSGLFGTTYAIGVGGGNHIYQLDLSARQVVRHLGEPVSSYRACSYLGDDDCFLITGGWNQHEVVQLGRWGGTVKTAPLADLADLAIYRPEPVYPDSLVWAYATVSNYENTIHKLCIGKVWASIGLAEAGVPNQINPVLLARPNPVRSGCRLQVFCPAVAGESSLSLWNAAGRLVRREKISTRNRTGLTTADLPAGVYLLTLSNSTANLSCKLVVLNE